MDAAGKNKRVTMIKSVVGKVKSAQYALPDIVYGIESKIDKEGAGKVIETWACAEPSLSEQLKQSFPATNRQALKNGCITSKAQREYGKHHPVMKQNPKHCNSNQSKKNAEVKSNSNDVITSIYQRNLNQQPHHVFGIQSKKNDASMDELLRCIPSELKEETDYPDLSGKKRKGRIPPAKATKASRSIAECRPKSDRDVARIQAVEAFKMKKFLNVQSKVKCYM